MPVDTEIGNLYVVPLPQVLAPFIAAVGRKDFGQTEWLSPASVNLIWILHSHIVLFVQSDRDKAMNHCIRCKGSSITEHCCSASAICCFGKVLQTRLMKIFSSIFKNSRLSTLEEKETNKPKQNKKKPNEFFAWDLRKVSHNSIFAKQWQAIIVGQFHNRSVLAWQCWLQGDL